jgi:hypothetical protein
MTKSRVFLLSGISFLLILGSLFCIISDREYWPFSQYPMFSAIERTNSVSALQLYGVTQEEQPDEILMDERHIEPFNKARFTMALRRMESKRNPEKRSRLLKEALLDSLKRYEKLRLAGLHDGPPLQGARLYRVEWQIDARLGRPDLPDHRKLIAEVQQDQ